MSDTRTFNAPTREQLQEKLDAIYATGKPFKDFTIRCWHGPHGVRYDTAVEFV